jgi:hypothetical protein
MVGARTRERNVLYPRSEAAIARGAGVETETSSAMEAYAPFPDWQPERQRPSEGVSLPWR